MKTTAYKCPDTGRIFEFKNEYNTYRRAYLVEQKKEENKQKLIDGYNKILEDFRSTPQSWVEMEQWICANTDVFVERSRLINGWITKTKSFKITNVNIHVRYDERCRNTHDAPFNGVTNWHCKPDLPRGYPGWYGTIELDYIGDYDGFFSNMFDGTGINFGSGSGGVNSYRAEVTFFEADWPGLRERKVFDLFRE